jgi:hypothetical protein
MVIEKILVAITFHYDEIRLKYLNDVCSQIPSLGLEYKLLVITNAQEKNEVELIKNQIKFLSSYEIVNHSSMGHPYFLPWGHLPIFKQYFSSDASISHFMYLEDDIKITSKNITYWLRGRNELYQFGFYPSFVRFEKNHINGIPYATDITKQLRLKKLPSIRISSDYYYLSSPQPYQGMYLMDREMLGEYFQSPASSPDFGGWGIREKATQGLTFIGVPTGFHSRNLIGYRVLKNMIDQDALVHHLPDNYANNAQSEFGKVQIDKLVSL